MTRAGRILCGAAVALALTLSLGALSRIPLSGTYADQAALRFSWRMRAGEAGECRRPTPEELRDLPSHMRNPDACIGPVPDFRLRVDVGGESVFDSRIEGSGARGDRPLFVYRELILPAGSHAVRVSFAPEGADADDPHALYLDSVVDLESGDVRLVTRDEDTGALEVVRPRG